MPQFGLRAGVGRDARPTGSARRARAAGCAHRVRAGARPARAVHPAAQAAARRVPPADCPAWPTAPTAAAQARPRAARPGSAAAGRPACCPAVRATHPPPRSAAGASAAGYPDSSAAVPMIPAWSPARRRGPRAPVAARGCWHHRCAGPPAIPGRARRPPPEGRARCRWPARATASGPPHMASVLPLPVGVCSTPDSPAR
ncbi:hypothetical protein G6F46_013602 [Rhizopus delemar]|nr:hypothetical protein G6F46_013602 [Rhizopus delemar]